jgi:O-antigen ligase
MSAVPRLEARSAWTATHNIRLTVAALGVLATAAGALGLTTRVAFTDPSTLKYTLSVALPVGVVLFAGTRYPLRVLAGLTILTAPFSIAASAEGITATPFSLFAIAAFLLLTFHLRGTSRATGMALAIPLWIALLTFAVARATSPFHYLLLLGTMLAMGMIARTIASEAGGLEYLAWAFVGSAVLQAAIAIWEFKTHHLLDVYSASGQTSFGNTYFFSFNNLDRPPAGFPDPISLGNVLALSLPLALALCVHARTTPRRVGAALAIAPIALGLTLTFSRMSWIGGAAGVLVLLVFLPGRRMRASIVIAAMATIAITIALTLGGNSLRERFSSLSDPTGQGVLTAQSDRTRQDLWHGALDVAEKHEIGGVGFGHLDGELSHFVAGVSPQTHAHSTYLQVFAEAGVLGLAAIAVVLLAAFSGALRGRERSPTLAAGLLGALVAMLCCWTTDFTVRYMQVAVFMAIVVGASAGVGVLRRPGSMTSR